jgi:LCP family protein required for cell wall assembly
MSESVDYPRLAQRRLSQRRATPSRAVAPATRRALPRPYRPGTPRTGSSPAHRVARPAAVTAKPGTRRPGEEILSSAGVSPAGTGGDVNEATGEPTFLRHELAHLRAQQRPRRRRAPRRPRTKLGMLALATPLLLLVAIAAIVGPVVYRGTKAYQDIFVEPAPRQPVPVAVRNAEGTPIIVLATTAGQSTAPTGHTPTVAPTNTSTSTPHQTQASPVAITPTVVPTRTRTPTATATPGEIPKWDSTARLTMLLLGVDRRTVEPSRSDTMILVNIDPVAKTASMIAIPRDLRVIIPGYGVHKINAAYAFGEANGVKGGGPALAIQTIETNFGVHIDYFAEVDFAGFVKIVDTLGGVTIDVPYPIKDDAYPAAGNNYMRVYFSAGWQHMDGERALQYARTRHDDGDGMRSVRQQQVLLALRQQAISLNLLTKAGELLGELGDAVRTDLSPTQALQLARLATELSPDGIATMSLDPALTEDDSPDGYYIDADWDIVGQILSKFAGTEIIPPMSALSNPRLDVPIRIEDRTAKDGLGDRVAAVLRDNGFTNVTVVDRNADPGVNSSVAADQANLSTAFLVAGLTGINLDAVVLRPSAQPTHAPRPAATSSATATATASGKASPAASGSPRAAGTSATATRAAGKKTAAAATATPNAEREGIVIVLGADARDPDDFTAEPFQEDEPPVGKKKTAVATSDASTANGRADDGSGQEPTIGPNN